MKRRKYRDTKNKYWGDGVEFKKQYFDTITIQFSSLYEEWQIFIWMHIDLNSFHQMQHWGLHIPGYRVPGGYNNDFRSIPWRNRKNTLW